MSTIGGEWLDKDFFSKAKANAKSNFIGTGTEILAIGTTYPGMLAICTQTSSGFEQGLVYERDILNRNWLQISMGKHTHATDDPVDGGLFTEVAMRQIPRLIWLNKKGFSPAEMTAFWDGTSGTSSDSGAVWGYDIPQADVDTALAATDEPWAERLGLLLSAGGAALDSVGHPSGSAGIRLGSTSPSFLLRSKFVWLGSCNANTQLSIRHGINTNEADLTPDHANQYGLEGCDSTNTPRSYDLFSGDSTTRSSITTSEAINVSEFKGYILLHQPASYIKFFTATTAGTQALVATKTNNVPGNAIPGSDLKTVTFSAKGNSTPRIIYSVRAFEFVATNGDPRWESIIE